MNDNAAIVLICLGGLALLTIVVCVAIRSATRLTQHAVTVKANQSKTTSGPPYSNVRPADTPPARGESVRPRPEASQRLSDGDV